MNILKQLSRLTDPFRVAQICNLLYRGIAFCRRRTDSNALEFSCALPITNRRYSRLKICATSYGRANTCLPTVARVLAGLFAATLFAQSAFAATVVRVVNTTIGANQSGTVIIEMVATGEEAALGFTLNFDPARLTFVNAVLGQSVTSATLNVNNLQASSGRVGIVVGVSPGQAFTAGTLQLINFSFTSSSVSGSTQITFGDVPVVREISNRQAQALAATFTPGTVLINSPPVANGQSVSVPEDGTVNITLTGFDADGDGLNFSIINSPTRGTLSGSAPNLIYRPNANVTGPDSFSFTASDGRATSSPASININIGSVNDPPTLSPIPPRTVVEGNAVTFAASATDGDVPPDPLTFSLEGAPPGATINPSSGAFSWTPSEAQGPGTYTITVRVTDTGSPPQSATQSFSVTVSEANQPPVFPAIGGQTVNEGSPLAVIAVAADQDQPPQTLNYSLDGAPAGATIDSTSGIFSWTPSEAQGPGRYTINVRVTDSGGASATASFEINVQEVNAPPTLAPIQNQSVRGGQTLSFTVSASDPDVPAQTLTFSLPFGGPSGASINPTTGTFSWTPPAGLPDSTESVTVQVTDSAGLSALQSFSIAVAASNTPPLIAPIAPQSINEGVGLTVNFSATDTDQPTQTLTFALEPGAPTGVNLSSSGVLTWTPTEAQGPGAYPIAVRVTDNGTPPLSAAQVVNVTVNEVNTPPVLAAIADQTVRAGNLLTVSAAATDSDLPPNALTYSLGAGAPAGASVDAGTGSFSWTPTPAQGGTTVPITILVSDNATPPGTASRTFNVAVSPSNTAPTLAPIAPRTIPEGSPFSLTITAADTDVPANTITYTLGGGAPAGLTIDPNTGVLSWTPTEAQGPSVNPVSVVATDNGVPPLTATVQITINVTEVNQPPTIGAIADQTIEAGLVLTVPVAANDPDLPPNTLAFSLGPGTPTGVTINSGTGEVSWRPTGLQGPATHRITVVATDNGTPALSANQSFSVVVTRQNQPPVLAAIPDQTVEEGRELTFTASATDPDAGQTIAYTLAPGAPPGATINQTTGVFTWTPNEAQGPGPFVVTVRATDNGAPSVRSTQDVRITVTEANVAPVLAAIPDQSITSTDTLRLTAKATDADVPANTLTYSLEPGAPAGATIDGVTGVFTFTPPPAQQPGTLRVSVRATDNGTPPLSDAKAFNIVIRAGVNLPPTISQISNQTTAENRPTGAIAFTVNDPDTPVANLRVTATSSNPTLVPTEGIVISGESTNRTVTITPAKDQTGTATITLRVEENTGGSATTSFDFTVSALPTGIAKQPEKQDVVAGGLAAFSVLATGSPPFTYQWRLNGTDIPGATNSVYTVSNVQTNHAGTYSVVVGNRVSSVTSAGAVLSVIELLRITKQPIGQAVLAGGNVTLVATAAGRGTLRYQWRLNGADLPGETNPSLVLLNVDITKAGTYSVRVSDETGAFVDSQGAVLVVNAVSAFTQQPQSQTVVEGTNVTFTVQATGAPPPRLQWQFNGVDIPGETGASLSLQNVRPPNAGQYSVVASNPAGSTNSAAATLTVVTAPAVSRQPQSQTAKAGDAVSFTVSVSGTEPIQYRWRFVAGAAGPASPSRGNSVALLSAGKQAALPGSEIPGATGPTLTVPNVQAGNVGEYFAVVSNLAGTAVSSGAKLDVLAPATITQHPQNQIANAGGTATFSVAATGTAPLIHQWRVNGVDVPGATNATFAMTNIQATDAGAVQVVVANAAGPVVSNPATLTVNQGVTIVTHPASQSATNGASVVFSVVAAGTPPLAYQWRFEGQNLPGQTGSSLTIASVGIVNSGRYTVAVRNVAGEVVSNEANLGVIEPPSIQTQPANQSVNLGATVTFTVVASGDAPLAYQWQKNGVNIPGATGPTLTISNVQPGDQGTYNVVVSNAGGALTSNSATLGVILPVIASGNSAQNAPPPIESAEGSFDGGSNEAAGGAGQIARKNAPPRTGEERWFSWRAPQSGIVTFTTVGSTFDTELAVFTGVAPNLTAVASDDDRGGFFSSEVKFNAVRGTTYLVQVKGFGGAAGKIVVGFKLQQTAQRLPEITSAPPLVQTVTAGQPVTLRVETRAQADPLSYQWFKDDTAIPGATQNQYTILSVRDSDAARYTVRITANPPGQSPVSIESLPAIVQIGTTGSAAVDKFKSAPSLSGGPQLQSLSGDFIKNAGGSVARGYSGSQVFNTFGASKEQGEPNHCDVIGGASQWFVYQGITNGIVRVSTEGSDFDTVLAVYTGPGTDFASLKLEACDNNGGVDGKTSALNLAVKQGTAYYIAVDGVKGATGTVRLSYQFGAGPAISVQPQSQSAPLGGTVAMFVETTNALSTVSTTIPQVGYQWQKDGLPVRGETNRSLALLSVKVADAGDYQVVVSNFAGSSTSAVARVSINVPLSFTLAPQSQTVKIGNAATFIATASGTPPISYQWRFNGLNVTGATNSTYEVPNVQPANAGAYSVVAQNPANTIESPPAFLGINQAPAITVPPVHQVAALNGSATFTVTAIGTPPLSYQWRLGGVDIPGAASATLTINNVSAANVGEYTVVVSNASDSVASPPARLDIRIPLTIVEDPQSQTVTVGGSAIFNVRVAGPTQMAFQWLKDGVAIPGANSANLALANVQPGDAGQYTVAVASGTEFAESKPATLTIGSAPVITRQPVGQIVFAGSTNVSFSVTATGAGPLSYQWFKNSAAIAGATNSTLALAVAQVADTGIYSVTVSNASGSAVSELAVLTVQQIVSDARFDAVTGFQFRLSIPAGKTATVESSADLVNWITVTPVPVTGIVDIQDPQAPAGAFTFYRIIIP